MWGGAAFFRCGTFRLPGERRVKKNCWEVKSCGRQPGGHKVKELGECPAASETRLEGAHGGHNAGRSCWVVAGTMCGGKVQGSFAQKYEACSDCEFYKSVKDEEGGDFMLSITLMNRLRKGQVPAPK